MYLAVNDISKAYGVHQVLNQVSFILNDGQRLGLVGANGVGKSTLLKIITGELEADSGSVNLTPGARIGYLPQALATFGEKTLNDLINESMQQLRDLERRMRDLEQQMAGSGVAMAEYAEVSEQFERRGGYEMDYRAEAVLGGLRVGHIERSRPVTTLSGGEKSRIGLALLLLQAPDLLLLDEPTNHLDFARLGWLEDYLRAYHGATLIVSHDRHFLNRTVTGIVEIDEHSRQAKHYTGDYDAYLQARAQEREHWRTEYERQQEEIKALRHEIKLSAREVAHNRAPKDGDKFYKGFKQGRLSVAISRRVGSAEEKLRRIEANPVPKPPEALCFEADFDPAALKSHVSLSASGLSKAYGALQIVTDLSCTLGTRNRITLVGPNGSGKSTLLKILAGVLRPDGGEITLNPQVRIGYLDQENEQLNPDRTVFEVYREELPGPDQQHISVLLSSGLFRYEELGRFVEQLSSGQKRKLQIARLMAERANLLLLDEPTNYVSFDILESIEAALNEFPGTIIAASHDRRFLERFGGEIWEMRAGQIIRYLDGFAGYLAGLESALTVNPGGVQVA